MGISGGVDSTVTAFLINKAIGSQLNCVFVDNGLLRKYEFQQVLDSYKEMGLKKKREFALDIIANDIFPHCKTTKQKIYLFNLFSCCNFFRLCHTSS